MPADAASAVLLAALEGTEITAEEAEFFRSEGPAGVTLFRRNISSRFLDLRSSIEALQKLNPRSQPFLVAIDQEGGRVSRLPSPFPNLGPALHIYPPNEQLNQADYLRNYGLTIGIALKGLGINWNFAPVCDVLSRESNVAIGDRCFGRDTSQVLSRAAAFLEGMEAAGVHGCLKHFPGQGDADFDTHEGLARIELDSETFHERELKPFVGLMNSQRPIMVSHAIYPSYDSLPASLSAKLVSGLLLGDLAYRGLVVSDDLNMKALPQGDGEWEDTLVQCLMAGVDLLLVCRGLDKCYRALARLRNEAARSKAFALRLDEAAAKVMAFRNRIEH